MKLCLVILAISLFDFSKGQTEYECEPNQIAKTDGCVPARPADFDNPQCMDKCVEKGSSCTVQDVPIFVWDQTSIYTCPDPGSYTKTTVCTQYEDIRCQTKNKTTEAVCGHSCHKEKINHCRKTTGTRPCQRLEHEKITNTIFTDDCIKLWVEHPCVHDSSQTCKTYECDPNAAVQSRPVTTHTIVQHVIDDFCDDIECEESEIEVCEDNPPTVNTYQELVNCKRDIMENCIDVLDKDKCQEVHHLVATFKRITRKVAVCDNGSNFDSEPYIYNDCESADCTVITEAAYNSLRNNPNYNETTGQIVPNNLLTNLV